MKTAVIYQSKYGHTKRYATWIAEALNADLIDGANLNANRFAPYDAIIYGGPIYAGSIKGIKLLSGNLTALKNKHLVVFTVGMSSPDNDALYPPIIGRAFPNGTQHGIAFFHLQGGIDPTRLSLGHRLVFAMVKRMAAKGKGPEGMELPAPSDNKSAADAAEKAAILPLVEHIQQLTQAMP